MRMGFESSALKKFFFQFQNVFFIQKSFWSGGCVCAQGNLTTVSVKRRPWTADCGPGVKCRLRVKQGGRKIQNEDCRLGVKCRLSINCSHRRVKGKKILQIHENDHLLDICFHKSIPLFSGTSSTTRKHNCNLEPFFCPRDLLLQL